MAIHRDIDSEGRHNLGIAIIIVQRKESLSWDGQSVHNYLQFNCSRLACLKMNFLIFSLKMYA